MKSFTLNQRQHYEDVPYGPALMEIVLLLKLLTPETKVCQRKTGTWSVKTQVFGRQENPKTGDINYGMIAHGRDMGINTAIHDAITRLCYRHHAKLSKHFFGKIGWQKANGAPTALTNEQKMKFSPLLVYHEELEYYIKNLQMDLLEALFDKEALREELRTQKLKVAKLEEQNLEIQKIHQELKDSRTMAHAKDVKIQKL